jgi:hypothetical protein
MKFKADGWKAAEKMIAAVADRARQVILRSRT